MTFFLFLIFGVMFIAAAVAWSLRRGVSGTRAMFAFVLGAGTGAVWFVFGDMIDSGIPADRRYAAMVWPQFAFQGVAFGSLVALAVFIGIGFRDFVTPHFFRRQKP